MKLASSQRRSVRIGLLLALVAAVVGGALFVGLAFSPQSGTSKFELQKFFIQFFLIVALGAIVSFTVEEVKGRSERRARKLQYEIDTVTSLLARLDRSYRAVKGRRRSLRVKDLAKLSKPEYVKAISLVSGDKEEIEQLWKDIQVLENWMSELKPVRSPIERMEKYLNALENEWEESGSKPDDEFQAKYQAALVGFRTKTGVEGSTFFEFRGPYREARKLLIAQLANKRGDVDRDVTRRALQADDERAEVPN